MTGIIPRSDYMNGDVDHQTYYGQFVTAEVRRMVLGGITRGAILKSTDPHLNDIPLRRWDVLGYALPYDVVKRIGEANGSGGVSLSDRVCVLKACARMIAEEEANEE